MGDATAGGPVDFDFEGSLVLARRLWSLADDLSHEDARRGSDARAAAQAWRGSYGEEFLDRRSTEVESLRNVRSALIDGANAWARAWAEAKDQQNKNNRAARIEADAARMSDDRGMFQRGVDAFNGDDSWDKAVEANPLPDPYPIPTGPAFAPTDADRVY